MFGLARVIASILFFAGFTFAGASPGMAQGRMPDTIDPAKHYLFYMHGGWPEEHGQSRPHPRYGKRYEYDEILTAFRAKGLVVIGEVREGRVRPPDYAESVADGVKRLLAAGVPPGNITVGGHSKGGMMTLIVSSQLKNPKINFVNLAGCGAGDRFGRQFQRIARRIGPDLRGRFLSMFESNDEISGSCDAAINQAKESVFLELVLKTGEGTRPVLFAEPGVD